MAEHILFLTGKLARKQLGQILENIQSDEFTYTVHALGVSVAALMTVDMILRRLDDTFNADRVILPGRCLGDIEKLSRHFGLPFERGPKELKDLPAYFGKTGRPPQLDRYAIRIFAEITDAPRLTLDKIIGQARAYAADGADIIDLGCLPNTDFPHLEESIQGLKQEGFLVSIDSLENDDLLRGAKAGADYMLSLKEDTLWIADEVASTPILIPARHGDLDSLDRAAEALAKTNREFLLDPILDPIHFGFVDSVARYREVRKRHPDAEMLMGIGNLTELTHADTAGMNALMIGMCSELNINNVLATQVSEHACKAIRETDRARRILFAAKSTDSLPKHIDDGLMALHECAPFPYTKQEIDELARDIRDPSFRIQTSREGIHIYNRDCIHTATDPFDLYPKLNVEQDGGHAFYLGVQLGRAQIAWQLGKRFTQDEPLSWGCAVEAAEEKLDSYKEAGSTLDKKAKK
ncbi:MAG: DUF6513 domain-containing protein [Methylococcaceae bacterium]|nr:DUF6513 domain-containing protein [Methylococcaceae bacterium]MCI0733410.1 DUF6513 domain-containing protein [Methylococcaceae bacterium]